MYFSCADQPELVTKYKYPLEIHDIVTADGYILQLHRISHILKDDDKVRSNEIRTPILLVHNMGGSSADWVLMGPGESLGTLIKVFRSY